jgi:hypothetical protein
VEEVEMTNAKAALVAAVSCGLVAVGDAVVLAVTGQNLVSDDSARWASAGTDLVHVAAYVLLAVGLVRLGRGVDEGRRWRTWVRRLLVGLLTAMAAMFAVGAALGRFPDAFAVIGGSAFLLHFPVAAALGVALLRRRETRWAGAVLASPLVTLPLMVLVGLVAPDWAHPAWGEVGVLLGLALVLLHVEREPASTPWRPAAEQLPAPVAPPA